MPDIIPILRADGDAGEAHFDLRVNLEGLSYVLEFRWNVRAAAWFLNLWDSEGVVPYATGVRLVANWPLLHYRTGRGYSGALMLRDTGQAFSSGEEPGFGDLGNRHLLLYFSSAEVEAANAAA